jgi:hypothetical protein
MDSLMAGKDVGERFINFARSGRGAEEIGIRRFKKGQRSQILEPILSLQIFAFFDNQLTGPPFLLRMKVRRIKLDH